MLGMYQPRKEDKWGVGRLLLAVLPATWLWQRLPTLLQ